MYIAARPSSPMLEPFVEVLWYIEAPPPYGRERVLPFGAMQLLVNLGEDELRSYHDADHATPRRLRGAGLQGPYASPTVIDTRQQRAMLGVGFRPGGAYPFFAVPASATREDLVELAALWGGDGAVLRERLLEAPTPLAKLQAMEAALLARAVRSLAPDPAMAFAVAALDRGSGVAAVTDRLGMTPKRLARRFADQVGLSPKRFARVRRFQRLLAAAGGGVDADWARLAVECGYYDQAHLIHDFRAFSGISPTMYRPRSPWARNHVPLPG